MSVSADNSSIGIVGHMGPAATNLLLEKLVAAQTNANTDQDFESVTMIGSNRIPDRTEYLISRRGPNPAQEISRVVETLHSIGARVIGFPCNTAHVPDIMDEVIKRTSGLSQPFVLVNMITETVSNISDNSLSNAGILSTMGSFKFSLYQEDLSEQGVEPIVLSERMAEKVHHAIYDNNWGLKSNPYKVSNQAKQILDEALKALEAEGAEACILGCTELPLAANDLQTSLKLFDPLASLASGLLREYRQLESK